MSGQEEGEAHQDQIRQHKDADGCDQVPAARWVLTESFFKFVNDLLVPVLYNKDIMKEQRGQAIDDQGEQDRLGPGIEAVMFDKMEIEGLEQEEPTAGAERKQVHGLDPGVERLPVLT